MYKKSYRRSVKMKSFIKAISIAIFVVAQISIIGCKNETPQPTKIVKAISYSITEGETDLGDGLFVNKSGGKIAVILPERLYATDDNKLKLNLLLILPKIYGEDFWKRSVSDYTNPNTEIRDNTGLLSYKLQDGTNILILAMKDPNKGVYAFSIWNE